MTDHQLATVGDVIAALSGDDPTTPCGSPPNPASCIAWAGSTYTKRLRTTR